MSIQAVRTSYLLSLDPALSCHDVVAGSHDSHLRPRVDSRCCSSSGLCALALLTGSLDARWAACRTVDGARAIDLGCGEHQQIYDEHPAIISTDTYLSDDAAYRVAYPSFQTGR